MRLRMSRRYRLAAPVAVAGAIALGTWLPNLAASASAPNLAPISAQDLLVKAETAHVAGLTGTVSWTANLGLPDLGSLTSGASQAGASDTGFSPTSLLSGTHQIQVWDRGADQQRLAIARTLGETDLIHNGRDAWLWDSSTQKVTHYVPAASSSPDSATAPLRHATGDATLTPDAVAQQVLSHLTPSTMVAVNSTADVAGRSAYVLSLAPKPGTAGAAASTVQQINVAVDSATGLPLQVQVFAKGSTSPALSVGFSSIDFSVPSTSEFATPHGVTTETKVVGHSHGQASTDPGAPAVEPSTDGSAPLSGGPAAVGVGTDWGKVYTLSHSSLGSTGRSASQLDDVTTVVTGKFGTARLLTTTLVNALIFPDGHVLIGAVTPATLEAAAAQG